jgi:hypothetical protein
MLKLEECAHTLLRGSFVLGTQDEVWSTDSVEPKGKRDDGADAIIACSGLSVPGIVLPSASSLRRVLTRSAYYYYPELPKVFHFYIGKDESVSLGSVIESIDNYLFTFNCRYPESTLHGKGDAGRIRPFPEDKYCPADPGVWIHDPLYAANNGKEYKGYHWSTDEEINSGKSLFEKSWKNYTRDIDVFVSHRLGVHGGTPPAAGIKDVARAPVDDEYADRRIRAEYVSFENRDSHDVTTFNPLMIDRRAYIQYEELDNLAGRFPSMLGYLLEARPYLLGIAARKPVYEEGWEEKQSEPLTLEEVIAMHALPRRRNRPDLLPPIEYVQCDKTHDQTLLSYFIDGLAASRPRAAFMSFYQILERQAGGTRGRGGDLASLKNLLNDTDVFSHKNLESAFKVVSGYNGSEQLKRDIRTSSGKWDREKIAELLNKEMRDPLSHARITTDLPLQRGGAGEQKNPGERREPIVPFSSTEIETNIELKTAFCRELARLLVLQSAR